MHISVLMSVYGGEHASFFREAVDSILAQTLPPKEVVIVKDGPLTDELERVLAQFISCHPSLFQIIALPENKGLGYALQKGVEACTYDIIARMDTDDVCHPERFQRQISYMKQHPHVDVLGTWIAEFEHDADKAKYIRTAPVSPSDIHSYSKQRNPLNHMTVMFKKKAVLQAGNYKSFLWNEDYYLWVRLLQHGFTLHNISDVLVYVRAGERMFQRRGGLKYATHEFRLQREFLQIGFITPFQFCRNILARTAVRLIPNPLRSIIYKRYLRQHA